MIADVGVTARIRPHNSAVKGRILFTQEKPRKDSMPAPDLRVWSIDAPLPPVWSLAKVTQSQCEQVAL